jgi:hypothetical protein
MSGPVCSRVRRSACCWSGAVPPGCPLDVPRALTRSLRCWLSNPARRRFARTLYFFGPVFDARYPAAIASASVIHFPFLVFP